MLVNPAGLILPQIVDAAIIIIFGFIGTLIIIINVSVYTTGPLFVQGLTNLFSQRLHGERLLDEVYFVIEYAVMGNEICGIT